MFAIIEGIQAISADDLAIRRLRDETGHIERRCLAVMGSTSGSQEIKGQTMICKLETLWAIRRFPWGDKILCHQLALRPSGCNS